MQLLDGTNTIYYYYCQRIVKLFCDFRTCLMLELATSCDMLKNKKPMIKTTRSFLIKID